MNKATMSGEKINDLQLFMDITAPNCLTSNIPDLLYGSKSAPIVAKRNNHVEITVIPDIYTINVTVKGLSAATDNYEFSIIDNNSHYNFSNSILGSQPSFKHVRNAVQSGAEAKSSIKVLHLNANNTSQLAVKNLTTNNVIFEDDLIETIIAAYTAANVDFEKIYTYNIELLCDANMGVSVKVNDWTHKDQEGELSNK